MINFLQKIYTNFSSLYFLPRVFLYLYILQICSKIKKNLIILCQVLILVVLSLKVNAQTNETLSTGSYIINMGVIPQTDNNGLKPYGLIYDLLKNNSVPIKWVISQTKVKDGADFVYNGTEYKGGTFIIPAEYRTAAVNSKITSYGVTGTTTTSPLYVSVTYTLTAAPRWTLDDKNGRIVQAFLTTAGIPSSAYNWKSPQTLSGCDDIFVMPHADPTWATHSNLYNWNRTQFGSIWAGCHAVSVLENMNNGILQTNFLANNVGSIGNSLVSFKFHNKGSPPFITEAPSNPVAQYMGTTDAAHRNGSEQIFLPKLGGGWRPTTNIVCYDPTQSDIPSLSAGKAALIAEGRGFGLSDAGWVMYEGGHDVSKAGEASIAAQRAFFNFSLRATIDKIPSISAFSVPSTMNISQTYSVSINASSPVGLTFTYQWSSSCGGTFGNANAASTTFTPSATGSCIIKCVVTDACGRTNTFSRSTAALTNTSNPPVPVADVATVNSNCSGAGSVTKNVLTNDTSPDGKPLTITSVTSSGALNGTFSFTSAGNVTYTPTVNFLGTQTFNYTVCDNTSPTPLCANSTFTITVGSGAVPTPVNDAITIAEDNIATINVLSNDGTGLTVMSIPTLPTNGKVSINIDGTITYVPNPDFQGTDSFIYQVKNTDGNFANATVTVTITNDACDSGTYQTAAGTNITSTVTINPTADTWLSHTKSAENYGGDVLLNLDRENSKEERMIIKWGDLSAIPTGATINSATIQLYEVSKRNQSINAHQITEDWTEGSGTIASPNITNNASWIRKTTGTNWTTANVTGAVTGPFSSTVLTSITAVTNNTAVSVYVTWATSANLVSLVQGWKNGTTLNYGILFRSPDGGGDESQDWGSRTNANPPKLNVNYTYTTAPTCATIPVRAPLAMPDNTSTLSNAATTISVLGNDNLFNVAATALTISTAPIAAQGSATANLSAGTVTFTPNPTFNGLASFQYTVTTANGSDVVYVYVQVNNSPIVANNDNPLPGANSGVVQTINVKANDVDPEGATLTVTILTQPTNGSATVDGSGNIVYTPNPGFAGNDPFTYQICEPTSACSSPYCANAIVTPTVLNQPPIAPPITKNMAICNAATINLLAGASDPEGGVLTVTNISALSNTAAGTLTNNNDGTVTFQPANGFNGTVTFTYKVTDNGVPPLSSSPAMVTINVSNPVNSAPIAVNDFENTNMDQVLNASVRDNDYDPDGNSLTLPTITIQPLHGTATVNAINGIIEYTPKPGYFGTDVLTYQIFDIITVNPATCATAPDKSATALLNITIEAQNTVYAVNDENNTYVNMPVSGGVIINDYDQEGDIVLFTGFLDNSGVATTTGTITVSGVDANGVAVTNAGTLTINTDGTYTFTPASNFTGIVSVSYTVTDNNSNPAIDKAELRITVSPTRESMTNGIIADNDEYLTFQNIAISKNVLLNDSDPQSDNFKVTAFNYDTDGITSTANVAGTVSTTGSPVSPVQIGGITTTGLPITNAGTFVLNENGTFTFTPATDFSGSVDINYTICDQGPTVPQKCASTSIHIDILPDLNGVANNAPFAGDDFLFILNNGIAATGNVITANDYDPNGNTVTISKIGTTTVIAGGTTIATPHGTITISPNGSYSYLPTSGYVGPDQIEYQLCDNGSPSLCAKATIYFLTTPFCPTLPNAPTTTGGGVCFTGTANLSASGCSGTYNWYATSNGGTSLGTTSTFTTPSLSTTTSYYVDCTIGSCTSATRTQATATVNPMPSATVANQTICNTNTATLTATNPSNVASYAWNTGATTSTINVSPSTSTTYTLTLTSASGCTTTVTASVIVNPLPSAAVANQTICNTNTATLTATSPSNVTSYAWNTGATTSTISVSPSTSTIYTLTLTSASGCTTTVTASVIVNPLPSAPTGTGVNRCGTGTVTLSASGCSGGTISWYGALTVGTALTTGATYTTPSISATTTYYLDCSLNGCVSSRASVTATVYSIPSAPTVTDGSNCGTGTVILSASGCNGGTIQWFVSQTGTTSLASGTSLTLTSLTSSTVYFASCTDANTCVSTTRNYGVATINPIPQAELISINPTCLGMQSVSNGKLLLNKFGGIDSFSYNIGSTYNSGSATAFTSISANGEILTGISDPSTSISFTVRIKNVENCIVDRTVTIVKQCGSCPVSYCEPPSNIVKTK